MKASAFAVLSLGLLAGCSGSRLKSVDSAYFSQPRPLRRILVSDFIGDRGLAHVGTESFIDVLKRRSYTDVVRGGRLEQGLNEARRRAVDLVVVGEIQSHDTVRAEVAYSLVRVFDVRTGREVARLESASNRLNTKHTAAQRVREASGRAAAELSEILQ